VVGIVIERTATHEILWAPISRWQKGIPVRRGYGPQRALLWRELKPLPAPAAPTPREQQLDLFADGV
jgi:hypothetical protein